MSKLNDCEFGHLEHQEEEEALEEARACIDWWVQLGLGSHLLGLVLRALNKHKPVSE